MQNQCKIHARKSDAKNMKNHPKNDTKRMSKVRKRCKKTMRKKHRKTEGPPHLCPGTPVLPGDTIIKDRRTSNRRKTKIISQGEVLKGEV